MLAFTVLIASASVAGADKLDLKGLRIGDSAESAEKQIGRFACDAKHFCIPTDDARINPRAVTFGGFPAKLYLQFRDGSLQRVVVTGLPVLDHEAIYGALIAKHGAPDVDERSAKGRHARWRRGPDILMASLGAGRFDVILSDADTMFREAREQRENRIDDL